MKKGCTCGVLVSNLYDFNGDGVAKVVVTQEKYADLLDTQTRVDVLVGRMKRNRLPGTEVLRTLGYDKAADELEGKGKEDKE